MPIEYSDRLAMRPSVRCENKGCHNTAKWRPVIIWRDVDGNTLLEGDTHLDICDDCKDAATIDVLMDDGQYRELVKTYVMIGKDPPNRRFAAVELRPL